LCVEDCVLEALSIVNGVAVVDPDACVECGVCLVDSCPADAILLLYPGVATIRV
jgi:Fe-S-cluster-containing hydrogenase component 2